MSSYRLALSQSRSRLRVLHSSMVVGKQGFGVGTAVLGLASGQHEVGMDLAVWSYDSIQEGRELELQYALPPGSIKVFPTVGPDWLGYSPAMEDAVRKAAGSFDVLHQHAIWTGTSLVSNVWRKSSAKPVIVDVQGSLDSWALKRSTWKKKLALATYEGANLFHASCFHALSLMEADSIRRIGVRSPIAIIPNGVSPQYLDSKRNPCEFRSKHELPPDSRLLLYLGRITPKKGLVMLLNAMASIKSQLGNWMLIIAGVDEFGYLAKVEREIACLGLEPWVRCVGPVYGQEKYDAFASAELFVLPSYSEGSPISILEAMGSGLPIITTQASPWEELNVRKCGWCTSISQDAITQALREALSQTQDYLAEKGRICKSLVLEKYTWEHIAELTAELYQWLIFGGVTPSFVREVW